MENIKKINVRAYGLLQHKGKILVLRERFKDYEFNKFPGGGLELGEGVVDTLKREFKEELGLEIEVKDHIYTQDFFLRSKFNEEEQLLLVYYWVKALSMEAFKIKEKDRVVEVKWLSLDELEEGLFDLPIDKLVVSKIK